MDVKNSLRKKATIYFVTVSFVLFLLQILNRFLVVYLFEDNPYHPYGKYCKQCFADHYYMSDNSFRF